MKLRIVAFLFSVFVLFAFIGCATNPEPFSFVTGEQNSSSVAFRMGNPGVTFVSFNGIPLPKPASGTHWDPINFPSGTALRVIVHVSYTTTTKVNLGGFGILGGIANVVQDVHAVTRNVNTNMEINLPPLEAGKEYLLTYVKEPGMPGKNILTLTEQGTGIAVFQQEFEVTFGGFDTK
ncbi:MAG: hypothetical protein FWD47_07425 [Treponema sp.]|nr:hypothetical protein [Treponema sp.]